MHSNSSIRALILCYNQNNYKALYLCAYLLHEMGYNVCMVGEEYKYEDLQKFLAHFLEKQKQSKDNVNMLNEEEGFND